MLRKKGIIALLIIAALIFLSGLVFTDTWLEKRLENLGSSIVGAKVEFDGLDLSLIGMHLKWDRLQVANPKKTMENMIETGECAFDIEFLPLLSKKVIIENFELSDLRTGTERKTDGYIEKKKEKFSSEKGFVSKSMERLENEIAEAPAFNLSDYGKKVNVDSVVALLDLQSPRRIDSLKNDLESKYRDWQSKLAGLKIEKEAKDIETRLKALDVKKIKNLKSLQKALKSLKKIKKALNKISQNLDDTKGQISSDMSAVKKSLARVEVWISDDYKQAMAMAKVPDINTQNIGKLIFGKKIVNQVNSYLGYVAKARSYAAKLKSDKPQKEDPPRLKGQDIYFYNKNARPDFWIKQIKLSGQTPDEISLSGVVYNIVSDQRLINMATDFSLSGSGKDGRSISLQGALNYLQEEPREAFTMRYAGFSLDNVKLSGSSLLPYKIKSGTGDLEVSLQMKGEELKGKINFTGRDLHFNFDAQKKEKNKLQTIIRDIVRNTKSINFAAVLSGKKDRLNFLLKSNLDELFVKNLKASLGKEVRQAKEKIRAKVDKQVNKRKDKLDKLVAAKDKQLQSEIKKYEKIAKEQLKLADGKKAEIKKQKKKLEGKVKDKLKNLF